MWARPADLATKATKATKARRYEEDFEFNSMAPRANLAQFTHMGRTGTVATRDEDLTETRRAHEERRNRVEALIRDWRVTVHRTCLTDRSLLVFGSRDQRPVVLKVVVTEGDEWWSGAILQAFDGRGVARVYEHAGGAVLMERVNPGDSLVEMAANGRDDEATGILAEVVANMQPCPPVIGCATVQDWAAGFDRHADSGDVQIPQSLVEEAHRVYAQLCGSQKRSALLHGDLHHDNVLFDADRGWLAIDPKGVVGEIEYELGATLRNPYDRPEIFLRPSTIKRRVELFARKLNVDSQRVLGWAFAQAVLAAIWAAEDGFPVHRDHPFISLANETRPMLSVRSD